TYFAPQDAPPPDADRIWLIIGEDEAIPPALGGPEGPWRLEPRVKGPGMWLWLGQRASGAAQQPVFSLDNGAMPGAKSLQ
ncbi:hypothetical protein IIC65_02635, partial [Candidatus Sumerlaeota bacterium]|nr:hypothetical protein [Candidatus Sumerlaeota bacterium]